VLDTVRPLRIDEIGTIHNDPVRPQPVSCGGAILPAWDDAAIAVLLDEIGAATPHMLELRHLGGALARPAAAPNAVGHRDADYSVFTSAYPGPGLAAAAELQTAFYRRLEPWSGGRSLYNFTVRPDNTPADARGAFDAATLDGLCEVTKDWDPADRFRFTVRIP
jgi:hypothetical protein